VPTRLGYAILFVSDLDRAIGFYRDVIGAPLRFRADAYAEFASEVRSSRCSRAAGCPG
jgi:catechol 2,3-dioxygenase-like lactoylglutathione lyase family enzyme